MVFPLITPGVAGMVFTVTARVCCADVPQLLLAVTLTFPPELLDDVLILDVLEVPAQPEGNVHV